MTHDLKKIAVLPGDGIGPEVMDEALKVLKKVSRLFIFGYEPALALVGGAAYDEYKHPMPKATWEICEWADAILFGSVGRPDLDDLPVELRPERGALLPLREEFKLYANLRPVKVYPGLEDSSRFKRQYVEGLDILFVRELIGDSYFAEPKFSGDDEAVDTSRYTTEEVVRIADFAFKLARERNRGVTSIDKANVLEAAGKFWRRTVRSFAKSYYPEVPLRDLYVDNTAAQMVIDPKQFDVILAPNMFGDILSDLGAAITGSLGMLPSASVNGENKFGMYEPGGGSAPDIAGKGIANPCAQVLSVAMMFRYSFDRPDIADAIEAAVAKAIADGYRTRDIMPKEPNKALEELMARDGGDFPTIPRITEVGTSAMGDAIVERLFAA